MPQIVYPFDAGVILALGVLTARLSVDHVPSLLFRMEETDRDAANARIAEMEAEGRA